MKRYDLHTHSNVSDGAFDPAEVVRRARDAGLDGIALSDHDSTAGIAKARAEGERIGLDIVPGCEVSSRYKGAPVHMLAYYADEQNARWIEELRWIRDDRVVRAEKMVEKLREFGVDVTMERVRQIARGESIGRPHVAQAMVEAGIVSRTPEAFTKEWIGDGGRAYVEKRVLSPQETVEFIFGAGGVAVIAHPVWIDREVGGSAELIRELVGLGLGGIEVDHPDHNLAARDRFARLADELGLIKTASSDYHGNDHGSPLGTNTCGEDVVEALRARAGGSQQ